MTGIGRTLVIFGGFMVVVGLALMYSDKIPLLGKLPGDIHIRKDHTEFYFPIVTSLVLSLALSGLMWLISYFTKK
jgi:hypothetical protein